MAICTYLLTLQLLKTGQGELQITWDVPPKGDDAYDQLMVLAYDIENGVVKRKVTGQFRSTGRDTLGILPASSEMIYHIYVAFVSADRSRQSDSIYLGTVGSSSIL